MQIIAIGHKLRGKKILAVQRLSNGWYVIKTENGKSLRDFKVRTIFQTTPRIRSLTPKHAHFLIDFYGKLCADEGKALEVWRTMVKIWQREPVQELLAKHRDLESKLPGYTLEYTFHALNWILDQEDVNFTGRPVKKQQEIDGILAKCKVVSPENRLGSQLAISLFCNVILGVHPVEALRRANLDIIPAKRSRGAV